MEIVIVNCRSCGAPAEIIPHGDEERDVGVIATLIRLTGSFTCFECGREHTPGVWVSIRDEQTREAGE